MWSEAAETHYFALLLLLLLLLLFLFYFANTSGGVGSGATLFRLTNYCTLPLYKIPLLI